MKLSILLLCVLSAFAVPAFADEDVKIVERKTCEQIKTEIDNLKAKGTLSDEEQAELKQLNSQQRASCGTKGAGRRSIPRAQPNLAQSGAAPESKPGVVSDALTEYMNNKKSNCEKLNSEIEKITSDSSKADVVAEMQRVYDMDCTTPKEPDVAPQDSGPVQPEKTDEEWAAEFNANLAAGLCGDGTKPNRYGCCTDEVFKDLGADGFACCPKNDDSLCFPPIK